MEETLSDPVKALVQERDDNTLAGGGEMGKLIREHNWTSTPLGNVSQWPQSLRTAVSICLASRFPIIIFWDQQLYQFYNDAFRPILGQTKHPLALGQKADECWPEIWDVVGPMLHGVLASGEATWSKNQLLLLDRNGYLEECYFTFSYSPIRDESGEVGGVFCAVTETSGEVVGQRRLDTLQQLTASTQQANNPDEVCKFATTTLANNPADLPFVLLYLLAADGILARLAGSAGLPPGTSYSPLQVDLDDPSAHWPFLQIVENGQSLLLDNLVQRLGSFPFRLESARSISHTALLLPITRPGEAHPYGFLVTGINPLHPFDDDYRSFCNLIAGQVATAITTVRAYQDARERAEALSELDRAKTAFFSNISHEFRTPLTLLLGPLDTLLSDTVHPVTEEQRIQLEMMRRNSLRQLKLVNTLLDFTRIEAGRADVIFEPLDLSQVTVDLASTFRSAVERAQLQFIVDCPPLPEPIYVDREMWEKIVLNLLSNAFKFTFDGSIRVSLQIKDDHISFQVADTGVGIPPEDIPHLFERFYRVRGTRSRTYEGSGIGLALVQELIRLHGGTIEVQSTVGVGTTITVQLARGMAHLPPERLGVSRTLTSTALGADPYVEEALRWLPELPNATSSLLIEQESPLRAVPLSTDHVPLLLVVDDNADMRDYLKRLLSSSYQVQLAADAAAALTIARDHIPDLILLDVMMPGMDGFAMLSALRADPATRLIPVIMLSARAGEEAILEGLHAGADDYLIKPFSAREVLARVQARLEINELRREATRQANYTHKALDALLAMAEMVVSIETEQNAEELYATSVRVSKHLAERTYQILPCQNITIIQIEPDTEELQVLASAGFTADEEQKLHACINGSQLSERLAPADLPLLNRLRTGEMLQLDVPQLPYHTNLPQSFGERLLVLPLRYGERLVGTVSLNRFRKAPAFSETEQALAAGIARLVLLVIERTRLLTERTRAQEEAIAWHSAHQRMAKLIELSHDAVIIRDPTSAIIYWNQGAELLYGWSKHEALGQISHTLLQTSFPYSLTLVDAYLTDDGQWEGTLQHTHRDGQEVIVESRQVLVRDEADMPEAILEINRDITEREHLLEEREEARANAIAAQEVARQMNDFIGIISHELKTPLTSIKGNLQLAQRNLVRFLKQETAQEGDQLQGIITAQGLLNRAERQIGVQNRLVNDLIDVSRIQADKLELQIGLFDLAQLVREAVEDQRNLLPGRTIRFETSVLEVFVLADAERVGQVVNNYLSNALKYSDTNLPVEVDLKMKETLAQVFVSDKGPGLSKEQQQRIWERFYRAPGIEVKSGSGVGLGLGLYICRTIIERQGGQVGVESSPGEGSTFWFNLPLAEPLRRV
jgi:PAS domain S-box-containing protein